MTDLGSKLTHSRDYGLPKPAISHWCPACETTHAFAVDAPFHNGCQWTFDGNVEKPTFQPSMNIAWGRPPEERCHYFLHAGRIQYLPDCTHAMAGQTVDLPDLPAWIKRG